MGLAELIRIICGTKVLQVWSLWHKLYGMKNEQLTETVRVRVGAVLYGKCVKAAELEGKTVSDWVRGLMEEVFVAQDGGKEGDAVAQKGGSGSVVAQKKEVELPRVAQGNRMKSITLNGGDVGGEPPVSAMGLAQAYAGVVLPRRPEESKWHQEGAVVQPKICVACKEEIVGTVAYTDQLNPICQPCARKRAGL